MTGIQHRRASSRGIQKSRWIVGTMVCSSCLKAGCQQAGSRIFRRSCTVRPPPPAIVDLPRSLWRSPIVELHRSLWRSHLRCSFLTLGCPHRRSFVRHRASPCRHRRSYLRQRASPRRHHRSSTRRRSAALSLQRLHRSSTRRRSAALSLQRLHLHHVLRPRDHRQANKVDLRTRPSPSSRVHRPLHRLTQDHRRGTSRPWHRPSPHHRRSQLGRSLPHVVVVHHMGRTTHRHRRRSCHRPSPIASEGVAQL